MTSLLSQAGAINIYDWVKPYNSLFEGHVGALEICIIIFGTIGSTIMGFSFIPQLITTFKTGGTTGLSLIMWIFVLITGAGFTLWGIMYISQGAIAKNNLAALEHLGDLTIPKGLSAQEAAHLLLNNWNKGGSEVLAIANKTALSQGLINGLASSVFTFISLIISILIFSLKVKNLLLAKKLKITEAQLCEQLYEKYLQKNAANYNQVLSKKEINSEKEETLNA